MKFHIPHIYWYYYIAIKQLWMYMYTGMSIDFEVAGENWKVAGKLMRACSAPLTARGLGAAEGPQKLWDKWCKILHSRPLLALNFIIETSFFCAIFLIFSTIVQDKRPFFTTFDYIVAVILALQFVDYKDVLRFYFFNAI